MEMTPYQNYFVLKYPLPVYIPLLLTKKMLICQSSTYLILLIRSQFVLVQVSCSLCSETMEREVLDVHKGENCPKRIVTCEYCEFPLPAIDLFKHQVIPIVDGL